MEYQKIIEQIKTRITLEEFEEKNVEFKTDATTLNIKPEQLEQYLVRRWTTYFSKALTSYGTGKKVKVKGVILSLQATDFGAKKQYENAIKMYNQDPQQAIQQELVDNTGNPIYIKGWNKKQKIDPTKLTMIAEGMFSIDGNDYKPGSLNLGKEKTSIIMNSLINFEATQTKTEDGTIKLNKNRITKFNIEKELTTNDIIELLENYAPGMLINIPQAFEIAKKNFENKQQGIQPSYKNFAIIGDMSSEGVNLLGEGKNSDVMTLVENDSTGDLLTKTQEGYIPKTITCWLDKANNNLARNINNNALNIIVIGNPSYNLSDDNQERLSINARGIIVNKNYIINRDAEQIEPIDTEESIFQ